MRQHVKNYQKSKHLIGYVSINVNYCHSFELFVDDHNSVYLQNPKYFYVIRVNVSRCQRNQHNDDANNVYPQLYFGVFFEYQSDIFYEQTLVIVCPQWTHKHVCKHKYQSYDIKRHQVIYLVLPPSSLESHEHSYLDKIVKIDREHKYLPDYL